MSSSEITLIYPPGEKSSHLAELASYNPAGINGLLNDFDTLYAAYCQSCGLDPSDPHIRYRRNRGRYKIASGPLYHLAEVYADARFVNAVHGREFDLDTYTDGLDTSVHTPIFPHINAFHDCAQIEGSVNREATDAIIAEVSADTNHPHYAVWQAYARVLPDFAASEKEVRGWDRPTDPEQDFRRSFQYIPEETIMPLVVRLAEHYYNRGAATGKALANLLLRKSPELAWSSTKSRQFFIGLFPDASSCPHATAVQPYPIDKPLPFTDGYNKHGTLWTREDLTVDPGETSTFCPLSSSIEMRSALERDRGIVNAMFAYQSRFTVRNFHRGRHPDSGSGAELHLIRTISVLGQTVIAEQYS